MLPVCRRRGCSAARPAARAAACDGAYLMMMAPPTATAAQRSRRTPMATTTSALLIAASLVATPSRAADPTCKTGILAGEACCLKSCTRCGGPNCGTLPGGSAGCCSGSIIAHADSCANYDPPCVFHKVIRTKGAQSQTHLPLVFVLVATLIFHLATTGGAAHQVRRFSSAAEDGPPKRYADW